MAKVSVLAEQEAIARHNLEMMGLCNSAGLSLDERMKEARMAAIAKAELFEASWALQKEIERIES